MSEKKQCVNCQRNIDMGARTCLYCNWWQADKPAAKPQPAAVEAVPPPQPQPRWNGKLLGIVAFAALLVIAFVIGSLVHGFEPSEVKAAQKPAPAAVATEAPAPPTANIPLVPDNSPAPAGPIEQPATTTTTAPPLTTTVTGAMGTDATAMTSQQYGATQAAPPPAGSAQTVDPRSVSGTVYGQTEPSMPRAPRPRRSTIASHAAETQPVPEYQPVPSLHGHGHARLTLTVDTSGRVRDIDVVNPLPGEMGRLIAAVQSWRFKPATSNGTPVTSRFTVDINVE